MTYIKCSSAAFKKYIPYHVISTYSCPWLKKCHMIFYWIKDVCLRSKTYLWNSSGSFPGTPWFSWSICTVYLEPERSLPSLTVQTPIHEHKAFHDLPSLFSRLTSLQPSWPSLCFSIMAASRSQRLFHLCGVIFPLIFVELASSHYSSLSLSSPPQISLPWPSYFHLPSYSTCS